MNHKLKVNFVFAVFLLLNCFVFTAKTNAQNWDVDVVKALNPMHPNSFVAKGLSASVYPIGIAVPVTTFIIGAVNKDAKTKVEAYEQIGSLAISTIIAEALKKGINRERPFQKYSGIYPYQYETGESFPSGHTTIAFATATTLSLQYKKWYVVVPAYAWAVGCAYSRLYLGEHYTTDVLAGAAIGTGSAFLSHWLTKKIFR